MATVSKPYNTTARLLDGSDVGHAITVRNLTGILAAFVVGKDEEGTDAVSLHFTSSVGALGVPLDEPVKVWKA